MQGGQLPEYTSRVSSLLSPLLGKIYSSTSELDEEITSVCEFLVSSALESLPHLKDRPSKRRSFRDSELKDLCNSSRTAWSAWNRAGRPIVGPFWEEKKSAKKTHPAKSPPTSRH